MQPGGGDADQFRSSLGRILRGDRVPTQRTRDSIQEALQDWSAPSEEDEVRDAQITRDEFRVWERVNRKLAHRAVES